jgi:hypothetical protein
MTTAVYNRQNLGTAAGILPLSPIDVRIESEATPEEISQFLISLASFITSPRPVVREVESSNETWDAQDYYRNKYGDSYSCCGALGFERSYLGSRADYNHIF